MAIEEELPPDEVVYRRIPESVAAQWLQAKSVDLAAFLPNKADTDGLSLCRAPSAGAAGATGRRGKRFFAVAVRVSDLIKRGLQIVGDGPTHALIKGWTYQNRKSDEVRTGAEYLSTICGEAEGPSFEGQADPPTFTQ